MSRVTTANPFLRSPGNNIHNKSLATLIAHYKLNKIKNNNSIAFLRKRLESGNLVGRIIFNIPGYGNLQMRVNKNRQRANANRARANATPRVNPLARPRSNNQRRRHGGVLGAMGAASKMVRAFL
jgi:hypothetical protein